MSLYSLKPTVVLSRADRRSRLHFEEGGEGEMKNELDMHIEDLLGCVCDNAGGLPLLTEALQQARPI